MVSLLGYLPFLQEGLHGLLSRNVSKGSHNSRIYSPEKLRKLAARMVMTTLKSPLRSAYSNNKTAARLLTGRRSHKGKGGGLKALSRAIAALVPVSIMWCMPTQAQGTNRRSWIERSHGRCIPIARILVLVPVLPGELSNGVRLTTPAMRRILGNSRDVVDAAE
jgi:hypothetical protein